MPISISRKTAYRHLLRIDRDSAFSSEVLGYRDLEISSTDQRLVHRLTLGVLREQLLIDSVISEFSSFGTGKLDIEILIALRIGVYQLLFLDKIPDYSAISESVELAKFAKKKSAAGYVNAVLRKISRNKERICRDLEGLGEEVKTSHPEWLLEKWRKEFGPEKAVSIAKANNREPLAAFRFTRAFDDLPSEKKSNIRDSISGMKGFRRSRLAAEGFVVDRIGETIREFADRGFVYFQDEASQLAAEIVMEVAGPRVLDMCAAPGSKATQIARKRGIELLVASEYYPHRARVLASTGLLQAAGIAVVCADGICGPAFAEGCFDTVLVDAPCSGTGTLRRNPEIRYRLQAHDFIELKEKQLGLALGASKLVTHGGFLVYSTCSIERDENEEVIRAFLAEKPGFEIFAPRVGQDLSDSSGFIRTFPDSEETDGFFVACLRRRFG